MPKPFDATLKGMLEQSPGDWAALAGFPRKAVRVVDADVSSVSGAADKVLLVEDEPEWLLHFEFQTGPDQTLPQRIHCYNALLGARHDGLVRSVVVLLRPEAGLPSLDGVYERRFEGEPAYLTFRYQVIRVWQLPAHRLLTGGLGTLALAPISEVQDEELPRVIGEMRRRQHSWPRRRQSEIWAAAYVLMGLRYEPHLVNRLLEGVLAMEESTTYQEILAKGARAGALAEAKKTLLRLGQKRFGRASTRVKQVIEAFDDLERVERLQLQVVDGVASWDELLDLPPGRTGRRKA
jgi:predicted transposase YdaD